MMPRLIWVLRQRQAQELYLLEHEDGRKQVCHKATT